MIVSVGSKKGKIILSCEDCGLKREVQRTTSILDKKEHPCRKCSNIRNGIKKRGTPSWNAGKRIDQSQRKIGNTYLNHHGYLEIYLGEDSKKYGRKDGYVLLHRKIAQDKIDRKLKSSEIIHHIDGDKLNNNPENLLICSGFSEHRDIHNNLEQVAFYLVKNNIIYFDESKRQYNIAPYASDSIKELGEFRERLRPEKL